MIKIPKALAADNGPGAKLWRFNTGNILKSRRSSSALHLHSRASANGAATKSRGHPSLTCPVAKAAPAATLAAAARTRLRPFASCRLHATRMAVLLCVGLLTVGCVPSQATKDDTAVDLPNPLFDKTYPSDADRVFVSQSRTAIGKQADKVDFGAEPASRRTRDMANWVVLSRDNRNMPFAIVDKVNATVYVFSADGALHAAAPALLGISRSDHSPLGVGDKPLSQIPVHDRTTPAGRFASVMGHNHKGKDVLWLDHEQALALHAVIRGSTRDRRAERLASATPNDNRISFGCINVPTDFFRDTIKGKFTSSGGVVYILPESRLAG